MQDPVGPPSVAIWNVVRKLETRNALQTSRWRFELCGHRRGWKSLLAVLLLNHLLSVITMRRRACVPARFRASLGT